MFYIKELGAERSTEANAVLHVARQMQYPGEDSVYDHIGKLYYDVNGQMSSVTSALLCIKSSVLNRLTKVVKGKTPFVEREYIQRSGWRTTVAPDRGRRVVVEYVKDESLLADVEHVRNAAIKELEALAEFVAKEITFLKNFKGGALPGPVELQAFPKLLQQLISGELLSDEELALFRNEPVETWEKFDIGEFREKALTCTAEELLGFEDLLDAAYSQLN